MPGTAAGSARPIAVVVALLLALAGVFASPAPARAAGEGVISGTILNWSADLVGTEVEVQYWTGSSFQPSALTFPPLTGPAFSFAAMDLATSYTVLFLPPTTAHAMPTFIDGTIEGPTSHSSPGVLNGQPGVGDSQDVSLVGATFITGTVRKAGSTAGLKDVAVLAQGDTTGIFFLATDPPTTSTGRYTLKVPGGELYAVGAIEVHGAYWEQLFDHLPSDLFGGGCGCGTPAITALDIDPGDPDVPGVDFEMHPIAHVQFDLFAEDIGGGPLDGLTVQVYRKVSGGWKLVEAGISHDGTFDEGYLALYGPGDGNYRIRVQYGGRYVPIDSYRDYQHFSAGPPEDPNGCYVQVTGLLGTRSYQYDIVVDTTDPRRCGAEKAIRSGSGSSGGSGGAAAPSNGSLVTPTPTPTPTPTATPTPSSSPTSEPSPEPSATETPAPEPAAASTDLWWVWVLIGVVLLGAVVLILVLVRRR